MIESVRNDTSCPTAGSPCRELDDFRARMRRFAESFGQLPVAIQATCPACRSVVPAAFERPGDQIVLRIDCPACGTERQVHHDAIWTPLVSDFPGSAERTFSGSRILPNLRRLPRTVQTLCPECSAVILGRYFVQDGAVLIEKTCPEHGYFRDCINRDVLLFSRAAWWSFEEHPGQQFPQVDAGECCPSDCGLCNQHISSPCLAQIDLTNRCNMRCPICFANANAAGRVSQIDYDQAVRQLQALRDLRPHPCTAIQFTGGEPTIHPDFLRIVSTARDMGFSHIQIATNGIRIADYDFARRCHEAGLHTLYLQFDGIGEEPYRQTRNYPGIWEKKLAAVENCRRIGMKICLVPTIVRGINDDQVGPIFQFAVDNIDVISAISYQPVSFTGRISLDELERNRYTLGDLARGIAAASGASPMRDMFPLSVVVPLSQILEALTGNPKIRPSCHTDCAFGTYFLVSPEGKAYPFPQVIDIEGMFTDMNRIAARIRRRGRATWLDKWRTWRMFKRHFRSEAAPPDLTVKRFVRSLQGLVDKNVGRGEGEKFTYKTLLCAGMHFQDRYNYDVERSKRCVILYSTPRGIFPFCTWNCGPEYRTIVEREYAARTDGGANDPEADGRAAQPQSEPVQETTP
ncbi:MAG: Cyclic pyranopterin monophosphate synthase [Planctomycetes bacterium ADurb.Bin126]|nr:MAG: Cyclic pyranopterin monophosphate synthase [Planctomycetes bacterium ADurb.Bin126]HOD81516.1 radical SAM protein [Phycisphaerae bacterium]HQL74000.1 radical SAM protein [Phycisphaerae bacterium]